MDGLGTFSKTMRFIGHLTSTDIVDGAEFQVIQTDGISNKYLAYTGNRVNLYVMDRIRTSQRTGTPGLSIGIRVVWTFDQFVQNEHNQTCALRAIDWDNSTDANLLYRPLTLAWSESKIEFAASSPGSGLQLGETDYGIYTFPINSYEDSNTYRNYVIPLVARGDFMRIYFWCDPNTWTGGQGGFPIVTRDAVYIWAMSGSDVAGSQRIGGGHG